MSADFEDPHLPAEVLQDMIESIPRIVEHAKALLGPIADQARDLRQLFIEKEWIEPIDIKLARDISIAAVDGAHVQETLYAGDLLVAAAVAAEGINPAGHLGSVPAHSVGSRFVNHDADNDRLAKADMTVRELSLFMQLPHDVVILDGSHQTPVIVINSVLSSYSREVRTAAVEILNDMGASEALAHLCDPRRGGNIIGCPKSDSSRDLGILLTRMLKERRDFNLPATDKVLASLVLEPGEMFKAFRVPEPWSHLHIQSRQGVDAADEPHLQPTASRLDAAIQPLRDRSLRITYAKPMDSNVAVKIEFKQNKGADWRKQAGAVVSVETPAPHLQEPFAQYLADQWAKSIGLGVRAQLQGVRLDLADSGDPRFLEYLLRTYRTIGG